MALTIHLDTNVYGAYLRGSAEAIFVIDHAPNLALSPVVIGELKAGFSLGSQEELNLSLLRRFIESPRVTVPPIEDEVTDAYAVIYRQLRRKGRPIPTNDLWIAACARERESALYSLDGHFDGIQSLRWIRGQEDFERLLRAS